MMHIRTLIPHSHYRHRRRHQVSLAAVTLLFCGCWWLQPNPASALYLNPQQQQPQMPELASNGAIIQALSQFAAQQVAGGMPSGSLQVAASTGANGGISISNTNNNNNNIGLVNTNSANTNNNQTGSSVAATANGVAAGSAASANGGQQPGNNNQFVIKWIHNDPKNQMAYVSITPVNYTNLHEPRIELRYQSKYPFVSLAENAANNTVVAAVVVNDEDSGPNGETTLSIEQGNELGHFKLVSTAFTNTIQVNGAPLSRHRVPEYNLTIVARDHGSPPKSSSSTLVIKLNASQQQSTHPLMAPNSLSHHLQQQYNTQLDPQPSLKPPVTDLMYVGTMLVLMFAAVVILIIFGCALVQRPQKASKHTHKGPPPTRTTSATNSRIMPATDQCSAYCLGPGYSATNL